MDSRVEMESELDQFVAGARRLIAFDPGRYLMLQVLLRAYLSIYEAPHESLQDLIERLREPSSEKQRFSA